MSVDICVCCGEIVPEGRAVCQACESKSDKNPSLYNEISKALDAYEHPIKSRTPRRVSLKLFYTLLKRVQLLDGSPTI